MRSVSLKAVQLSECGEGMETVVCSLIARQQRLQWLRVTKDVLGLRITEQGRITKKKKGGDGSQEIIRA